MLLQAVGDGLVVGLTYALVGLGFGLIYQTGRFFHLAHASVYTWGAYAAWFLAARLLTPLPVAMLLGAVFAGALGSATEIVVYAPLRRRGHDSLDLLVASLGLMIVLGSAIPLLFGDQTRSLRNGAINPTLTFAGLRFTSAQLLIVGAAVSLYALGYVALFRTRIGLAVRAVRANPALAASSGIDPDSVMRWVFAVGSGLAGVAAVCVALDLDLRPTMGFQALLLGAVAVIVGGIGTLQGALVGGLVVGEAHEVAGLLIGPQWADLISFGLLLVVLLIRPTGLVGARRRRPAA